MKLKSKRKQVGISLEMRLITLPMDRMLAAIQAIDDLDLCILEQLEYTSDAGAIEAWKSKLALRRVGRQRFVEMRRAREFHAASVRKIPHVK